MKKILIIAGEASGDLHGANLVIEAGKLDSSVKFFGVGSRNMARAGVTMLADASEISVVGATEVLARVGAIYGVYSRLKQFMRSEKPDLLILIDFPDFNIMVGKAAKKLGIPILYYISPQVWAWRKGRVKTIASLVKAMIVAFPFEADIYKKARVDVRFTGHPLIDVVKSDLTRTEARRALGLDPDMRTTALLPGSRKTEIMNLLPDMLAAARLLKDRYGDMQFVLPVAQTLDAEFLKLYIDRGGIDIRLVDGGVYDALKASDVAIVTSGTATLETGLMEVPMVVMYRMSALSFHIVRMLANAKHIALVNIIAGRTIVPELIQDRVTPQNIAHEISSMLDAPALYAKIKRGLAEIRASLGGPGASARAAGVVMEMLKN